MALNAKHYVLVFALTSDFINHHYCKVMLQLKTWCFECCRSIFSTELKTSLNI